ncbi:MAG: DUF6465 family protein [Lachnospiraceae bacterium]
METMEKEQGGITMASKKRTPAKNVTKAAEVKTAEVKAEAVETAEAPATEAQAEVKAEAKPAEKAVKKAAPKAAKAPKAEKKEAGEEKSEVNVVVEFNGTQRKVDEIVDKIKAEWVEAGHRVSTIKSLDVYIKPQDYTAYYVINGKVQGKVWM